MLIGSSEVALKLLKHPRIDPSINSNTFLRLAYDYGEVEVVRQLLMDSRVDPSENDNELIINAWYIHTV